jgi:hypothetical protein
VAEVVGARQVDGLKPQPPAVLIAVVYGNAAGSITKLSMFACEPGTARSCRTIQPCAEDG